MTIQQGDTLGPVLPDPDPEPEPELERQEAPAADPFDLGIAATVSGRNLRAMAPMTSFRRRPSRYQ